MCSFPRVQNTKNGEYMFPPLAPGCLPKIVMKSVRWTGGELLRNGWNTCGTLKNGRTCVSLLRLVRFRGSHKASKSLPILVHEKFGTAEMHGYCALEVSTQRSHMCASVLGKWYNKNGQHLRRSRLWASFSQSATVLGRRINTSFLQLFFVLSIILPQDVRF